LGAVMYRRDLRWYPCWYDPETISELPSKCPLPTAVRNARSREKDYKLKDEGALYLLVTSACGRLWRMNYRFEGKQRPFHLGLMRTAPGLPEAD